LQALSGNAAVRRRESGVAQSLADDEHKPTARIADIEKQLSMHPAVSAATLAV
jgi:hypothetical protein